MTIITTNKIKFSDYFECSLTVCIKYRSATLTTHREEKIGTPGNVFPPSTMKLLPETYFDESCIRYLISDVNAGSDGPNFLKGTVFKATLLSQSFCIRSWVISDLKSPGFIEFTLILSIPSSREKICQYDYGRGKTKKKKHIKRQI